jgi:hypothetical protein
VDIHDLFENLWRRRLAVAVAVALATLAGLVAIFRIDLGLPPRVEQRSVETGAGVIQLVLDSPRSPILEAGTSLEGLTDRAAVFTNFMQSPLVAQRISRILAVPVEEVGTRGAPPPGLARGREIDADQRATELAAEEAPYRLYAASSRDAPVITFFTRAPDPAGAVRVADAATTALTAHVEESEARHGIPAANRVQVRPLGRPQAEWVNRGARYQLAGLAFVGVLAAAALAMSLATRVRKALAVETTKSLPAFADDGWLEEPPATREPALAAPLSLGSRPAKGPR